MMLSMGMVFGVSWNLPAQVLVDESAQDPSFVAFRRELSDVIGMRDMEGLKQLFSDTIYESKNGCEWPGCSKSEFFSNYFTGDSSRDWEILERIQACGFLRMREGLVSLDVVGEAFFAPSYHKDFDEGSEVVILGKHVNIRKAPSLKSAVIYRASYEKFNCDCSILTETDATYTRNVDGFDWLQIRMKNGKVGYVATKFTSVVLEKRIVVQKVDGEWKIAWYYHPPGC